MGQQSASNILRRLCLGLALVVFAIPAQAGDPITRIGVDLGPLAHSNQGRGGNFIDNEFQLPFAPGTPIKIKRIEDLNKFNMFDPPIDRFNFQAPMSSTLLGAGLQGNANKISGYIGPSSFATPVPAPGGIALVLGVGLLASRRRR